MICPHCQKQIPSDSLVCGYCGHKIEEVLQKEENPAALPEENVSLPSENETGLSAGEADIIPESPAEPVKPDAAPTEAEEEPVQAVADTVNTEPLPDEEEEIKASQEDTPEPAAIQETIPKAVSPTPAAEKIPAAIHSSEAIFSETPVEESLAQAPSTPENKADPSFSTEPVSTVTTEPAADQKTEGYGKKPVSPEKKLEEAYLRRMAKRQRPLKTASFFWTEFLLLIPGINLVLLFVWAFRKKANANRKAFARSILIWLLIFIVFLLIVLIVMIVLGVSIDKYIWLKSFQDWVAGLRI